MKIILELIRDMVWLANQIEVAKCASQTLRRISVLRKKLFVCLKKPELLIFLLLMTPKSMGVVGDHPVTLVTICDLKNPLVLLGCLAFVVMIVLEKMKIKGNIIIGILVFSVIAWVTGLAKFNGVVGSIRQSY